MANRDVTVVIPAYNEALSLASLLPKVKDELDRYGARYEVLVVDDASTDGTPAVARQHDARVISHPYNKGNGAAVKTGIRHAQGDAVVLLDADGQHNPGDIPRLLELIGRYDLVVGARDNSSRQVWYRRLVNAVYNAFASYVTGIRIPDLTSGFRAVRTSRARNFLYLLPNTFSYPTTMTVSFIRAGYNVTFVPITSRRRTDGRSKVRPFRDGARFFVILFKVATLFSPLKIFLPLSLFLFALGVVYTIYTLVVFTDFRNMSVVLLVFALVIFVLALISEQVAQLRFQDSDRWERAAPREGGAEGAIGEGTQGPAA